MGVPIEARGIKIPSGEASLRVGIDTVLCLFETVGNGGAAAGIAVNGVDPGVASVSVERMLF